MTNRRNLDPLSLPLTGRQLIEASAGTGKTFNITRIYLRLLLERNLTVRQILVVTFTKAATEELRGRIATTLRSAYEGWGSHEEPFLQTLQHRVDPQEAKFRLQAALLELDEASIFTIHGFCQRVLSQEAVLANVSLEAELQTNTQEIVMEAIRDWLRKVAEDEDKFRILESLKIHEPDKLFKALNTIEVGEVPTIQPGSPEAFDRSELEGDLVNSERRSFRNALLPVVDQLKDSLNSKNASRASAWDHYLEWLDSTSTTPPKDSGPLGTLSNYLGPGKKLIEQHFSGKLKERISRVNRLVTASHQLEMRQHQALVVEEAITSIQERVTETKGRRGILDYDDLILKLSSAVESNPAITEALRSSYPAALVDEFQDTDNDQYRIFDTLYPKNSDLLLVMIGDPKQAIYSFRGGDIFAYLKARKQADEVWMMDTNWRSTQEMVTAYNRLFWGAPLNIPASEVFGYGITYEQIKASSGASSATASFCDNAERAALNFVWSSKESLGEESKGKKEDFQEHLSRWVVAEVSRLLVEATIGQRPLRAGEIAILVRGRSEAAVISQALSERGLQNIYLSDRSNVFASKEAWELLWLLTGIWSLEDDRALMTAFATSWVAWDAAKLAKVQSEDGEEEWEAAREWAMKLRGIWQSKGALSMLLDLIKEHAHPEADRHSRSLTNMLHLAELVQGATNLYPHPRQLLTWLRSNLNAEAATEEAELRLESDDNLIRIITQHGSKGLEYPVVFIPFASALENPLSGKQIYRYFDENADQRITQVGRTKDGDDRFVSESFAEAIRLLYVAITRAEYRCYVGVAPFNPNPRGGKSAVKPNPNVSSSLARILAIEDIASDESWENALDELMEVGGDFILKINASDIPPFRTVAEEPMRFIKPTQPASFTRRLPAPWQVNSFSSLVRRVNRVRAELENRLEDDSDEANESASSRPLADLPLRFRMTKGASSGNLLHDLLEHADFQAPDYAQLFKLHLPQAAKDQDYEEHELKEWLAEILETPIASLQDSKSFCLRDLPPEKTLKECEFYFPLKEAPVARLAQFLSRYRQQTVAVGSLGNAFLKGMMHGFIDLIFEHQGRYYIADYKSNHLGNRYSDYDEQILLANIQEKFYDLQYLIYLVALHRFLKVRVSGYDPATHLGGVYYFYLRGMSSCAPTMGVYGASISSEMITELDGLFEAREVQEGAF